MLERPIILEERRQYSEGRLAQILREIEKIKDMPRLSGLCIYATGSYGRLEASKFSDLDLFFVKEGTGLSPVPKTEKILLDAELIKLSRNMGFPEFTGYGQYLEYHYLDDMLEYLGSPRDDYDNLFTARLLLLLESQPIYDHATYNKIISAMIATYYRDYHDHEQSFMPIFLVNDIIRFWKTLCLNYEHKRNRPDMEDDKKNEAHLRNLKLKYSRMLTCFSAVVALCSLGVGQNQSDVLEIVKKTPLERLSFLAKSKPELMPLINSLFDQYSRFLEMTGKQKEEQVDWISDQKNRDTAFGTAREFGSGMYGLLQAAAKDTDTLRYVVI